MRAWRWSCSRLRSRRAVVGARGAAVAVTAATTAARLDRRCARRNERWWRRCTLLPWRRRQGDRCASRARPSVVARSASLTPRLSRLVHLRPVLVEVPREQRGRRWSRVEVCRLVVLHRRVGDNGLADGEVLRPPLLDDERAQAPLLRQVHVVTLAAVVVAQVAAVCARVAHLAIDILLGVRDRDVAEHRPRPREICRWRVRVLRLERRLAAERTRRQVVQQPLGLVRSPRPEALLRAGMRHHRACHAVDDANRALGLARGVGLVGHTVLTSRHQLSCRVLGLVGRVDGGVVALPHTDEAVAQARAVGEAVLAQTARHLLRREVDDEVQVILARAVVDEVGVAREAVRPGPWERVAHVRVDTLAEGGGAPRALRGHTIAVGARWDERLGRRRLGVTEGRLQSAAEPAARACRRVVPEALYVLGLRQQRLVDGDVRHTHLVGTNVAKAHV